MNSILTKEAETRDPFMGSEASSYSCINTQASTKDWNCPRLFGSGACPATAGGQCQKNEKINLFATDQQKTKSNL